MSKGLKRRLAILVAMTALTIFGSAQARPQEARRFELDVQPLDQTLAAFSVSTGLQMLYDSSLASGRRSSPVSGRCSRGRPWP